MRVIAYNILGTEKEYLAKANAKVHDLTFISNGLNLSTVHFAAGKECVIISERDHLDRTLLNELFKLGVKSIVTRSKSIDHIDVEFAGQLKMHIANTPLENNPQEIATRTIQNLTQWMVGGCAGEACQCRMDCVNKVMKG
ncbi:lactate dehydrogenase [Sphingobacterium sp. HJSM2_6]|uniref:lactate dehydrogenase n=1 Tax=Sphingobacterium sp. HJSM2_6 TaxID=3366264 RepID=UPI003BEBC1FE